MAHLAKYTLNSAQMLFHHNLRHQDRTGEYVSYHGSKIDITKTHLNYRLDPNTDPNEFITQRLSEIKVQKRADVKVYCSWVLTVPQNLPTEKHREFFESAYRFFSADYGAENIVMASVHLDETTPHMHLGFVPVVREKKNQKKLGQEKVSAKELLTRTYIKNLHKRLKNVLERDLNCRVDITIDLDDDAPKREYVPLATLKKQTEAEAKKLKETERKLAELEQTTADLAAIDLIQPKKVPLSSRVSVTPEEFETLSEQAKAYAVTKETLEKRSKSLVAREKIVHSREALLDTSDHLRERNKTLTTENSLLRDQLSSEKDKNIKLEAKIRGFAVYAKDRKLLEDTRAELEDTRSLLAKEKEEHEKTRTMFESSKNFYSTLLEGIRLFAQTYLRDISIDGQRISELPIRELARCFVSYCKKHMEQEQTQQKQVNRHQNGPER